MTGSPNQLTPPSLGKLDTVRTLTEKTSLRWPAETQRPYVQNFRLSFRFGVVVLITPAFSSMYTLFLICILMATLILGCTQQYRMYDLWDDHSTTNVTSLVTSGEYLPCVDSTGVVVKLMNRRPPHLTQEQHKTVIGMLHSLKVTPSESLPYARPTYSYTYLAGVFWIDVYEVFVNDKRYYVRSEADTLLPGIRAQRWTYRDCHIDSTK